MKFNRLGEAVFGIGDGSPSLRLNDKGVVLVLPDGVPGGGGSWIDDDTIIYQRRGNSPSGEILETLNVRSFKRTRVSDRGANVIVAGGGKWAAWLAGDGAGGDAFGTYGDIRTETGIAVAASFDGAFLVTTDYQSGFGHNLIGSDGRITSLPDDWIFGPWVIDSTTAIWSDEKGAFRTLNMPVPMQVGPSGNPVIATVVDEDWILYWTEGVGLVAHPTQSLQGYVLETSGHAFNHSAVGVNGKLRVGWSLTQGESVESQVVFDMDLTQPRIDLSGHSAAGGSFIPSTPAPFRSFTTSTTGSRTDPGKTSTLVQPQLGLLEDDIVYRLALLAVNVLQPLRDHYPNIVIKSGFRQVNSGVSQHETGEAVDIQINNQTPELLYEVANWMQHNLPFDQLVLSFTNIGDGQPWIHVSFSPQSLRQQVLTKDFADTFHEGLFFVESLTGEEAAAAVRAQDELDALIFKEMQKSSARNAKMLPVSSVTDEVAAVLSGTAATSASGLPSPGGSGSGSGGNNPGGRAGLVACVQKALSLAGTPYDSQENANIAFEVAKRVAWLLKDEGCGLLVGPPGGENIVQWNGYYFRAGRVCFADGQIYKILTGVENGPQQGGHAPQWSDDGIVEASLYVPAMDPGSDINMNWLQCGLPAGTGTTSQPPAPEPGTEPGNGGGPAEPGNGGRGGRDGRES
jgi:hypothetical protein